MDITQVLGITLLIFGALTLIISVVVFMGKQGNISKIKKLLNNGTATEAALPGTATEAAKLYATDISKKGLEIATKGIQQSPKGISQSPKDAY